MMSAISVTVPGKCPVLCWPDLLTRVVTSLNNNMADTGELTHRKASYDISSLSSSEKERAPPEDNGAEGLY